MVKCNIGNLLSFVIMFMEYIYKLKGDFECCLLNVVTFLPSVYSINAYGLN